MSKNLTRKGLVLGALVALGSTAIAGPAYAVDSITLSPVAGTSYNTTLGGEFQLGVQVSSAPQAADLAKLRFKIVQSAKVFSASVDADLTAVSYAADTTANTALGTDLTADTTIVTHLGVGKTSGLKLTASGTASVNAQVTAWFDLDSDGVIDGNEYSSATRTVNFLANSSLTAVASLTAPVIAATSLSGSAVITPELNGNYATDVKISYTAPASATLSAADVAASLADGKWSGAGAVAAVVAGAYTAQAKTAGGLLGSVATQTVATATVAGITAAVTDNGDTEDVTPTSTNAKISKVRTGVKSAEVVLSLKKADGTAVAAGIPAVVTVTSTAITTPATALVTVNGTAAAAVGSSITLNVVTDSNGLVKLAVANQLGTATDKLTFSATSEGVTLDANTTGAGTQTFALLWADATFTVVSTAVGGAQRSISEGGSVTFEYEVKDNYGTAIGSGARLAIVTGGTTAATANTYVPLVGGKASTTFTDTTANVATTMTIDAGLQTQDAATSNWAPAAGSTTVNAAQQTVNVTSTALTIDVAPVAPAATNLDTNVALTGAATAAISVSNAGAAITVSSNGVTFTVGGKEYANTVTLFTGASGDLPSIQAKSTVSGTHTITFTSGTDSKTAVLTINPPASNSGTTLSIISASKVKSGSTVVVTAKLVDKWGNGVPVVNNAAGDPTVTLAYDGPGFVTSDISQNLTDGVSTFRVLLGATDTGAASVTFTYDADGTTATTAKLTKTSTILIGVSASVSAGSKKANVVVKNAEGLTVKVVSGSKVTTKTATSDSYKLSLSKLTSGSKTVKVYVNDILVTSKKVTVRR